MENVTALSGQRISDYKYEKLQNKDDIRLVTILAGRADEDIVLRISHVPLPPLEIKTPPRISLSELRETSPPNWRVAETVGKRYLFMFKNPDDGSWETSWTHPIPSFDPALYIQSTEGRDGYEPKYEALSYTWGSSHGMEKIYVRGDHDVTKFRIGRNLASAIRHLRYLEQERTIWVDAVCIDQSDMSERNAQVPRMTNIYKLAHRVIVWLGPASETSTEALKTLDYLGKQTVMTIDQNFYRAPGATEPTWNVTTPLPYGNDTWIAIRDLLLRDWFERLWVVQEIQLARDAVICCGPDTVHWPRLWQAANFLNYYRYRPQLFRFGERIDLLECLTRDTAIYPISTTIMDTIHMRECVDRRDRIYGLLGLLPEAFCRRIKPQYSLAVVQVYKETVLAHIEHVQRLELLRACRLDYKKQQVEPSWVPDFLAIPSTLTGFGIQFAAGFSRCWTSYIRDAKRGRDMLYVAGVKCATICSVKGPFGDDALSQVRALEPDETLASTPYVGTGEPLQVAFAKAVAENYLLERLPRYQARSLETWMKQDSPNAFFGERAKKNPAPAEDRNVPLTWEERESLQTFQRRPYIATEEGHIGFGSFGARVGDLICVVLGYESPLQLRPHPKYPDAFSVVGSAFVYGLNDAIGLLGPLPDPWRVQVFGDAAGNQTIYRYFNAETGELWNEDPRLGPLVDKQWERLPWTERTTDDPTIFQRFRNKETGQVINHDPRMDPDALVARGVNIENICLI